MHYYAWISLRHSFTHSCIESLLHSFIHSFAHKTLGNKNAICLKRAQYLPSTAHYRGTDRQTDGQTDTLLHTHLHTVLGAQIEPLKSHRNFTIAKYSAEKCPQAWSLFCADIFITDRRVWRVGACQTPTSVHSTYPTPSLSLSLPSSACMHTDCAYATFNAAASPAGLGCDLLLPPLLLPVLPSSLIWPLNSWLTNFAGFQLRPCAAQQGAWRGRESESLAIKMPKRIRAAR